MILQNLKIAFRRIVQNYKLNLLIFIGLVIGLTSCLVIYIKVNHELSFDSYHTQSKNIFRIVRVTSGLEYQGGGLEYRTGVYFPFPAEIKKSIPGLKGVVSMFYVNGQKISIPSKDNTKDKIFTVDEGVVFTEPSFFDVFDFGRKGLTWLKGEGKQVLEKPFTAVITKEIAGRFFPGQDPIGQEIALFGQRFTVSGVISDLPQNTDFPFKVLLSMVTFSEKIAANVFSSWDSLSDTYNCYVVLNNKNEVEEVEKQLKAVHAMHRHDEYVERRLFKLQPLSQVHRDSQFGNYSQHTVSGGLMLAISLVGIFIFLIAFFNYSNFFLADTIKQKKQIALKLILGSKPGSIFVQFFTESLLVTFCALIISILTTFAFIKNFPEFVDIPLGYTPEIGWSAILFLLLLFFAGGILSVVFSYYNLNLSSMSSLLKKSDPGYSGKENVFGKWSVILQFVVAQAVIIATLMIVKQIYFINNKDLGYDTKNIMVMRLPGGTGSKQSALAGEYAMNPKIKGVTFSSITPAQSSNFGNAILYRNNEMVNIDCEIKAIDTAFIRVYSIKMLVGENLASADTALNIIVNRKLTSELGFKTVDEALGAYIKLFGPKPACIKGIVENFYSGSLHDKIRPCVMVNDPNRASIMSIKLRDSGSGKTSVSPGDIDQIKTVWNKILPDKEFEYSFLSDRIASYYESENKAMNLFLLFAAMTIILCVLGILGLSLSMNERRIKEIGIRKVNGATVQEILILLNKNFVKWVAIAFVLATPVAWYAMSRWLENFAYKTTLSWWIFLLSGIFALVIALLTVTWQSWKAAAQNPVVALRYE
jgi:putative ABC transport system permease protein